MNPSLRNLAKPSYAKAGITVPLLLNLVVFFVLLGNPVAAVISEILGLSAHPINIFFKMIASSISIFLILLGLHQKKFIIPHHIIYLLIVFILSILFLSYSYFHLNLVDVIDLKYVLGVGIGSIILPVTAIILYSEKVPRLGDWLFFWLFIICLAFTLLADTYAFDMVSQQYVDTGRLNLPSLNPISVAMVGGLLVLLSFFMLQQGKSNKIFILLAGILGFYVLIWSSSRSPVLGVMAGIMLYFFIKTPKLSLYLAPIFLCFFLAFIMTFDGGRLTSTSDPSISARISIYEIYYSAISDNFLFPVIPVEYSLFLSHNIILGVYSSSTIFGVFVFISILIQCFIASFRLIAGESVNGWVGLFFVFIFTISFFSGALLDFYFWVILALVVAYSRQQRILYAEN